jgi:hypothetical protein
MGMTRPLIAAVHLVACDEQHCAAKPELLGNAIPLASHDSVVLALLKSHR